MYTQPIRTGEAGAVEQLQQRIADAEALQERMKAVNLAIRQNASSRDAQRTALVALGYTEAEAVKLLKPDFINRIGYADYALKNNNANIRRLKLQLLKAERLAATPATEEIINGVTVSDNAEADRVQIRFPRKPSPAFCERLSHSGFHWAPTLNCWQRYRSEAALAIARQFAQQYPPATPQA